MQNAGAIVFYSSQGGSAEALASRYASELWARFSLRATTADVADYDHEHMPEIPSSALVVFLLSTYGEGDPPDSGIAFLETLRALHGRGRLMDNLRYIMFGLGNSNYNYYNKFAIDVDGLLTGMGAGRLGALGLGDDRAGGTEEDFVGWKTDMSQRISDAMGLQSAAAELPYTPLIKIRPLRRGGSTTDCYHGEPPGTSPTAEMSDTFILPVKHARRLDGGECDAGHTRQCVHMEFSLEGLPSATYETGDYLSVWPMNPEHQVKSLLKVLDAWETRKDVVEIEPIEGAQGPSIRIPTPTTIETLFRHCLEICGPVSRELLSGLIEFASEQDVKDRLKALACDRDVFHNQVTLKKLTLAAVLQEITTPDDDSRARLPLHIPLTYVLEKLKKLQPRSYSISSSSLVDARLVAVTALAVTEPPTRPWSSPYHFRGVTSHYLLQLQRDFSRAEAGAPKLTCNYAASGPRGLLEGSKVFARIRRSNFKLPQDSSTPILMVGSGTGIAPFRGFVMGRMKLKSQGLEVGKTILLVGHRAPDQDFYYRDLWFKAKKVLGGAFEVHTAFSRAQGQPGRYVQDVLANMSDQVLEILGVKGQGDGLMYICGSSAMANDVKTNLTEMWSRHAQQSRIETRDEGAADKWLKSLGRMRRLQQDSWG